jgi:POT family proton-dependent oligopeptide transporter
MGSVLAERHPKGLYTLFFTEMWERFGFYTMIAIFTLYMKASADTGGLALDTARAGNYYAIFMGLVYFTPLLGGLAADLLLGERLAISIGALFLGAGYFLLAVPPREGTLTLFYLAMASIVVGNGLFKPNISTMVGKLYPEGSPLRDAGFNIFYTGINLGAMFAPIAAPLLRTTWSWQVAFGAAGAGMLVSLIIFSLLSGSYADALRKPSVAAKAVVEQQQETVGFAGRIAALAILYLVSTVFWALFFQNGFALTLWADDCTARPSWLPPEVFLVVNPTCIVLLSSPAAWFWRRLGQRGLEPSTPDKILLGLVVAIVTCLVIVAASLAGGDHCVAGGRWTHEAHGSFSFIPAIGTLVSMAWLVVTYVMVSLAEILVSPMGLSYCTKVAPRQLGGLVMGGWFASLAAGGYLSGFMGSRFWESLPHSTYFGILAGGMLAVSVLLLAVRGVLRRAVR